MFALHAHLLSPALLPYNLRVGLASVAVYVAAAFAIGRGTGCGDACALKLMTRDGFVFFCRIHGPELAPAVWASYSTICRGDVQHVTIDAGDAPWCFHVQPPLRDSSARHLWQRRVKTVSKCGPFFRAIMRP